MNNAEAWATLFAYDPATGIVSWRERHTGRAKAGSAAGTNSRGYIRIELNGKQVYAHRVAWTLYYGTEPQHEIDHINGDKADNRITNLRDVPRKINLQNKRAPHCNNLLGIKGVAQRGKRFRAVIRTGGNSLYLGVFDTAEEAHAAYVSAKRLYHEGNTL